VHRKMQKLDRKIERFVFAYLQFNTIE
jgi:hypothetical protein